MMDLLTKFKTPAIIICFLLVALLTNCASHNVSTIVGGEYNASKDVTEYFVLPFGEVSLPGKWEKGGYNKVSRQQFFINQDSISVAIAFGRIDYYEFNQDGALKGFDFVNSFYEWESKFYESNGFESQLIEKDSEKHYVIFRIFGKSADTFLLFGERNGNVYNLSVNITDKWTEEEKIQFLKGLFLK